MPIPALSVSKFSRLALLCLYFPLLCGCSNLAGRATHAASVAARDPWTWGPLSGAAVIAATDSDERISHWAKTETPVWGSTKAAEDASDQYRLYASTSAWAIFLAARPKGEEEWLTEKGIDASGNLVGLAMARNTTGVLKHAAQRERPHNGPVHDSFPSAHATDAFAHASLARYYGDDLPVNRPLRFGLQATADAFAIATAWGRVEGGVHYPTDVLAGAAIANFTTRFFMELLAPNKKSGWRVQPRTDEKGDVIIEIEKPL